MTYKTAKTLRVINAILWTAIIVSSIVGAFISWPKPLRPIDLSAALAFYAGPELLFAFLIDSKLKRSAR